MPQHPETIKEKTVKLVMKITQSKTHHKQKQKKNDKQKMFLTHCYGLNCVPTEIHTLKPSLQRWLYLGIGV